MVRFCQPRISGLFTTNDGAISLGDGSSDHPGWEATEQQPVSLTLAVQSRKAETKPLKLPQFDTFTLESSPGSRFDTCLKVRLARLQLEKEEREFPLRRELELCKLEAQTAFRMRELKLHSGSVCPSAGIQVM